MTKSIKVLKVRDPSDSFTIKHRLMDLPFRMLICAKSGHGKSNLLTNILCNEEFGYTKIFKGSDIHIWSPTIREDQKMQIIINFYDIEDTNLHTEYDEKEISDVYDQFIEQFEESIQESKAPTQKLIILDDLSSSGAFSKNRYNIISKLFCNSRKFQVNIVLLSQMYTHVTPTIRSNASALFIFNTNLQALEAVESDNNYLENKKSFFKMFRANVKTKFDFLFINYSNEYKDLYLNSDFQPIQLE